MSPIPIPRASPIPIPRASPPLFCGIIAPVTGERIGIVRAACIDALTLEGCDVRVHNTAGVNEFLLRRGSPSEAARTIVECARGLGAVYGDAAVFVRDGHSFVRLPNIQGLAATTSAATSPLVCFDGAPVRARDVAAARVVGCEVHVHVSGTDKRMRLTRPTHADALALVNEIEAGIEEAEAGAET